MYKTRYIKAIYKCDLKDTRDGARLAPAEWPFHNFAPLKWYPFLPIISFFQW